MQADSTPPHSDAPEVEHRQHAYRTNRIPWFVHLLWLCFWIFAISYVVTFLVPAIQVELVNRR